MILATVSWSSGSIEKNTKCLSGVIAATLPANRELNLGKDSSLGMPQEKSRPTSSSSEECSAGSSCSSCCRVSDELPLLEAKLVLVLDDPDFF